MEKPPQDNTAVFVTRMQQRVAQARTAEKARTEADERRRQLARALFGHAIARFRALATAMPEDFDLKETDSGSTLSWKATKPERRLQVGLSRDTGDVLAVYTCAAPEEHDSPFHRLDPADTRAIDQLLDGLAEEEVWLAGRFPKLPGQPLQTTPG
jgi:hypothetical protein